MMQRNMHLVGVLRPGVEFSTPYESRCVVVTAPDDFGSFYATDSDGVLCSFGVAMVDTIDRDAQGNYGPIPAEQARS